MTASTLLSLNFNDQSIVDNTGQWEVLNDGSDVLKFALVGGSANYSLVVDHFAYESPAVLGIINPTDYATEYTIDFDMYVPLVSDTRDWVLGFKNAATTDATIIIYLENGEQVSGSIYKYNVCFQRRTNYIYNWSTYAITSDKPVRSGEWTKVRIKALKNTDTGYYEFEIYVNGVLKASNTTTYPITTTLENQLTLGGPSGTAYLLCEANSVMPAECPSSTGCALDNLIITRGEAPLRPSVVSLAGLQQNNANLLSYVHSKLATVATTGSYDDLTDKPVIPTGIEFATDAQIDALTAQWSI